MKEMLYPPFVQWEVTSKCNHNCVHCYNYWRKDSNECSETAEHITIAKKIIEQKPISVVITGGEPLIVFDSIKESMKLLKSNGISISINTNAVLVTDEIAEFLHTMNASAFVSLPCSEEDICDQITNVEGSLKRISKGIRVLMNHGVPVTVNMVVSKRNLNYIYDTAKYAKEILKVSRFFASRVSKPINSDKEFIRELLNKEEVTIVYKELSRISEELGVHTETSTPMPVCLFTDEKLFDKFAYSKSCSAGKTSYGLDCLGNIKACPRDIKSYGNILTDDFNEVWKKMSDWREEKYLPNECELCNVKNLCKGGCRLDSFPITGERNSLDPVTCLENLPVKFKKIDNKKCFSMEEYFFIMKDIKFVKEKYGWRVNNGRKFVAITEELKEFLTSHKKFSIKDFMNAYGVEYSLANDVVNVLFAKNIISICKTDK